LDDKLRPIAEPCHSAMLAMGEVAGDLRRYVDSLDFDEAELAEVEARLGVLRRLCDKYGGGLDDVVAYRTKIEAEMADLVGNSRISRRSTPVSPNARGQFEALAKKASAKRRSAARKLRRRSTSDDRIGNGQGRLRNAARRVRSRARRLRCGRDVGPDQPRPGDSAASEDRFGRRTQPRHAGDQVGTVGTDRSSVMVFDEVDAHVGGRLGSVIGEKLRPPRPPASGDLHHPSAPDRRLRDATPERAEDQSRRPTRTVVRIMEGQDRVDELAEMIAGPSKTSVSVRQAKELLDRAGN